MNFPLIGTGFCKKILLESAQIVDQKRSSRKRDFTEAAARVSPTKVAAIWLIFKQQKIYIYLHKQQ